MILSDDTEDIKQLLRCFFWLIYSKTDGCLKNGHNTFGENGRQRISTGVIEPYLNENNEDNIEELESF